MRVGIVYGGKSGEHEVSLLSASSVVRNIDAAKFRIVLIGMDRDGRWYLQDDAEVQRIRSNATAVLTITADPAKAVSVVPGGGVNGGLSAAGVPFGVDVVFPVLHGSFGEDGTIQGLFEMAHIPYVGGGVMASSVAMDKEKTKQVWQQNGLPIVPYICVRRHQWNNPQTFTAMMDKAIRDFSFPLFVKPCCAGSSVGASKANDRAALETCIRNAFEWDDKVMVEACVAAREIECSVTGNEYDLPVAYTPGEIAPTHDFYDYEAKYIDPNGARLKIPAELDDGRLKDIRELAVQAYQALDMSGLSRVDFFIDRNTDKLYLNEINTIPGFTSISMFSKMCEASGLPYSRLIELLLGLAVRRFEQRSKLKTDRGGC